MKGGAILANLIIFYHDLSAILEEIGLAKRIFRLCRHQTFIDFLVLYLSTFAYYKLILNRWTEQLYSKLFLGFSAM